MACLIDRTWFVKQALQPTTSICDDAREVPVPTILSTPRRSLAWEQRSRASVEQARLDLGRRHDTEPWLSHMYGQGRACRWTLVSMCFFSASSLYTDARLGIVTLPSVYSTAAAASTSPARSPAYLWVTAAMMGGYQSEARCVHPAELIVEYITHWTPPTTSDASEGWNNPWAGIGAAKEAR